METRRQSKIGRGKHMSIAAGAIVAFKEEEDMGFIYSGDIEFMHRAIDKAGANHVGPDTTRQVLNCIRSSKLWIATGTIPGWGHSTAKTYEPSKEGEEWYMKYKESQSAGKDAANK